MRTDDELLSLVRANKRHKIDNIRLCLEIDPYRMGDDHELFASCQFELPVAQFSMDPDTIVAQVKTAAKVDEFIKQLDAARSTYVKQLGVVYGPLMRKLYEQYSAAHLKKTPDLFEMRQTMMHIKTFAKEIALREDTDEGIFDAKRIDNELQTISEEPNGCNDF